MHTIHSRKAGFLAAAMILAILRGGIGLEATAQPVHGIAMYGEPSLPQDFDALPYATRMHQVAAGSFFPKLAASIRSIRIFCAAPLRGVLGC